LGDPYGFPQTPSLARRAPIPYGFPQTPSFTGGAAAAAPWRASVRISGLRGGRPGRRAHRSRYTRRVDMTPPDILDALIEAH